MLGGGLWNDYGACELEYNDALLVACQQHRLVVCSHQYSFNTRLSFPSRLSSWSLWPQVTWQQAEALLRQLVGQDEARSNSAVAQLQQSFRAISWKIGKRRWQDSWFWTVCDILWPVTDPSSCDILWHATPSAGNVGTDLGKAGSDGKSTLRSNKGSIDLNRSQSAQRDETRIRHWDRDRLWAKQRFAKMTNYSQTISAVCDFVTPLP